jgi:signal transduction histidine kinase
MGGLTPFLALGLAGLATVAGAAAAVLWALAERRRRLVKTREFEAHLASLGVRVDWDQAWTDAFGLCVLALEEGRPRLVSGEESLDICAAALGVAAEPRSMLAALMENPAQAVRLRALIERGEPVSFHAHGPAGGLDVEGATSGAIAWLKLSRHPDHGRDLPSGDQFTAFLDGQPHPAWISGRDGALNWANPAWLEAVEAPSLQEAAGKRLTLGGAADAVAAEARQSGSLREALVWVGAGGQRKAFKVTAGPLAGGLAGALAVDVTEAEETREAFKRHVAAHDETLNRLKDAVAMFSPARRLSFHNTAFAELWGLEPGWLDERPSHGEILDRLRQSRRLPETDDYAKWKAAELAHYQDLDAAPDDLWTLPDGRTLRVVRQPHPLGGLLVLFSDVTDELRLRAQYNALIQVQQATLDKLNDAVAVFGSDGRLRLHNEAFERFWNITPLELSAAADFDAVVELCLPRLHDRQFWSDLKARVGDPDPTARVPVSGEARTSDRRIVVYQSRPLPDGATLIAFTDVTDTRDLERALGEREAALSEAERLKRDFVGNVSYELRTPLTTILGYAELLDSTGAELSERARSHVAAVRQAASQLARSIDDVLDMAQIDADEMALDLGDVDVCELLDEVSERWRRAAEVASASIELTCEDDAGVIRADRRRLAQVLDHLIENAVRQSPPGGMVSLSAKRLQSEVQISVSDEGRGIPFHVQAHIFDRFVGRDRGGPGLGLALVKALVELHGGWVALESEPGKGATFTCHVPQMAQASAAHPELQL